MLNKIHVSELGIDLSVISWQSISVAQDLQQAGFQGLLVGGCVRDLLMGLHPKDYDVVTDATPEQAQEVLSRSRIIGRRFKIVHVRFGREIVEVATFRRATEAVDEESQTHHDSSQGHNDYGDINDDVHRRDFSINALYLDPVSGEVLDYVGALDDVKRNQLRCLGDPKHRFIEDPVRMIRAVRFRAKLAVNMSAEIATAIAELKHHLNEVPAARLFDEVLKLFHHAHALRSWELVSEYGLREILFRTAHVVLEEQGEEEPFAQLIIKALTNTDLRVMQEKPVIPSFLFAVLLWPTFQAEQAKIELPNTPENHDAYQEAMMVAGEFVFSLIGETVAVPRRVFVPAIEIWQMQAELEAREPNSIKRIIANRRFRAAYDFLLMRCDIEEVDHELGAYWTKIQEEEQYPLFDHSSNSQYKAQNGKRPYAGQGHYARSKRGGRHLGGGKWKKQDDFAAPQDEFSSHQPTHQATHQDGHSGAGDRGGFRTRGPARRLNNRNKQFGGGRPQAAQYGGASHQQGGKQSPQFGGGGHQQGKQSPQFGGGGQHQGKQAPQFGGGGHHQGGKQSPQFGGGYQQGKQAPQFGGGHQQSDRQSPQFGGGQRGFGRGQNTQSSTDYQQNSQQGARRKRSQFGGGRAGGGQHNAPNRGQRGAGQGAGQYYAQNQAQDSGYDHNQNYDHYQPPMTDDQYAGYEDDNFGNDINYNSKSIPDPNKNLHGAATGGRKKPNNGGGRFAGGGAKRGGYKGKPRQGGGYRGKQSASQGGYGNNADAFADPDKGYQSLHQPKSQSNSKQPVITYKKSLKSRLEQPGDNNADTSDKNVSEM